MLKLVKEKKIEAEQEIQLYLMILELQGKTEEMYNVLCSPLGELISSVPQRKAKLLLMMERYEEALEVYEELISNELVIISILIAYLLLILITTNL